MIMRATSWWIVTLLIVLTGVVLESAFRYAKLEIFGLDQARAISKTFWRVMGGIALTAFAIGVFVSAILLWVFAPAMP
jgi:hypothetical protein